MFDRALLLLPLLILLSACGSSPTLKSEEAPALLRSVPIEGEGRGRLGVRQSQNLFSFESALKENADWVLAVSIPLHGEEVLVLPDLREERGLDLQRRSFEARIERTMDHELKGEAVSGKEFIRALRAMIRFIQSERFGLAVSCQRRGETSLCSNGQQSFELSIEKQQLRIIDKSNKSFQLVGRAHQLHENSFTRTDYFLLTPDGQRELLSLELFWK
jgi:hypothetical protein